MKLKMKVKIIIYLKKKFFEGHMENINRLAKEGKLVVAGPFMKNDRNYRGIFIFNCKTVEEAQKIEFVK